MKNVTALKSIAPDTLFHAVFYLISVVLERLCSDMLNTGLVLGFPGTDWFSFDWISLDLFWFLLTCLSFTPTVWFSLCVSALLGTNFGFSLFFTGSLETRLVLVVLLR